MLHFAKTLRVVAATALFVVAVSAQAAPAATDPEMLTAEFGIFEDDGTDQIGFGATAEIPLAVGQPYGWLIQLKTTKKALAVREEVLLPQTDAPPTDTPDSEITLSPNRELLHGLNERRVPVSDGVIFGVRKVAAGDRPGRYRMKVYVERKLAASFDYFLLAVEPVATPSVKPGVGGSGDASRKPPAGPSRKGRMRPAS